MSIAEAKRRVSYVIPPPTGDRPPPWLELPSFGSQDDHDDTRAFPQLTPKAPQPPRANGTGLGTPWDTPNGSSPPTPTPAKQFASRNPFAAAVAPLPTSTPPPPPPAQARAQHPRHRLGVSCLALDTSTVLHGADSPGGILYSGGRDGLVASWELHIPHTKRRGRRYRTIAGRGTGSRVRWDRIGDGGADWDDENDNEGEENNDGGADQDSWGTTSEEEDDGYVGPAGLETNGSVGKKRSLPFESRWEVDHESIARQPPPATTFRESVQTHTDWVNDMVLCNMNQTVITASSDRTIRAWSPHAAEGELAVPALIGHHTDYVRSLAFARHPGVLFSGALDRDISVWDIANPRPNDPILKVRLSDIDDHGGIGAEGEWGSIYALGVDPKGQTLAAGTPERVVRLWDPRVGDRSVTKLVGHTECVRSILLSDDGMYMLTGSSDTTVKLWSVGEHRCLHTFNHHTSSVWALHSNHPNLERFYSGSRDGHLCVVDVEQCGDISDGECVVLAREGDGPRRGDYESKTGDEAIRSITSMDDEYVWTATSSSDIRRWRDVGRRVGRLDMEFDGASYGPVDDASQPLVPGVTSMSLGSIEAPTSIIDSSPLRNKQLGAVDDNDLARVESRDSRAITFAPEPVVDGPTSPVTQTTSSSPSTSGAPAGVPASLRERLSLQGYRRSPITSVIVSEEASDELFLQNGIPYESLVCLGLPDSPYSFGFSGAGYSSVSLTSAMRARSPDESGEAPTGHREREDSRLLNPRAVARRGFESREVASEAKPLRTTPDAVIGGSPGLIRSLALNDRLHVLTIDTQGEVAVWHLVRCVCLGRFEFKDVAEALELERGVSDARTEIKMHPTEVLELVQRRIEGKNSVLPWCQVDTKVGQITVHLEGDRVFAAEILSEEIGLDDNGLVQDSHPLNVGKVMLGNLFKGLIKAEEVDIQSAVSSSPATQASSLPRSPVAPSHMPHDRLGLASPRHRQRALSSASLSGSGMSPSINIAGLATPAGRAAIRPLELTLGQSAPSSTSDWMSSVNVSAAVRTPFSVGSNTPMSPGGGDAASGRDYFSLRKPDGSADKDGKETPGRDAKEVKSPLSSTPSGGGLLGKKFKGFGKKKNAPEPQMSTVVESKLEEAPKKDDGPQLSDRDKNQLLFLDGLRSRTFAPPPPSEVPAVPLPDSTAVIISEQSQADGAYIVTYRSQVSSTERDMEPLEMNSPFWLLNFLFTNSTPEERRPPKIPFVLLPVGQTMSSGKGLKVQASRTARVRGVIDHLVMSQQREAEAAVGAAARQRKMSNASATSGMSGIPDAVAAAVASGNPADAIEVLCGDFVAHPDMKVGTLKHYYWRGGVDMVLHWRLKDPAAAA